MKLNVPELVVFDLDFTLWDCGGTWCDCLTPPFRYRQEEVTDRRNRIVQLYDDVLDILEHCERASVPMAIASRTEQPTWARELVSLLGIADRFRFSEIYPSTKTKHFAALREASKIDYEAMLFFDDETRNIVEVSRLDVTCVHVTTGINNAVFQEGWKRFQHRDS